MNLFLAAAVAGLIGLQSEKPSLDYDTFQDESAADLSRQARRPRAMHLVPLVGHAAAAAAAAGRAHGVE